MSEALRMPTDEVTGLPHPIYVADLSYRDLAYPDVTFHHHFYDRRHSHLMGTQAISAEQLKHPEGIALDRLAGIAVRMSRGQRLPSERHREVHDKIKIGPALPHTLDEKFLTAVKACTGVVSRRAIDIASSTPEQINFIDLDDDMYSQIAGPRLLCTERAYLPRSADPRRRVLGNFFLRYAIKQDLSHVSHSVIDEFLFTTDEAMRRSRGHEILREAMQVGIAPVIPIYRELRSQGLVHPGRPELQRSVWKLIHPDRRQVVFRALRKKLLAA